MSVKNSPVSITSRNAKETAQALRDLAIQAEQGDCIGAVVGFFSHKREGKFFTIGYAQERPRDTTWLLARMKQLILDNEL